MIQDLCSSQFSAHLRRGCLSDTIEEAVGPAGRRSQQHRRPDRRERVLHSPALRLLVEDELGRLCLQVGRIDVQVRRQASETAPGSTLTAGSEATEAEEATTTAASLVHHVAVGSVVFLKRSNRIDSKWLLCFFTDLESLLTVILEGCRPRETSQNFTENHEKSKNTTNNNGGTSIEKAREF